MSDYASISSPMEAPLPLITHTTSPGSLPRATAAEPVPPETPSGSRTREVAPFRHTIATRGRGPATSILFTESSTLFVRSSDAPEDHPVSAGAAGGDRVDAQRAGRDLRRLAERVHGEAATDRPECGREERRGSASSAGAASSAGSLTAIRDSADQHYIVRDAGPGLEHVYLGIPAKKAGGTWFPKAGQKPRLIRRALTVVVGDVLQGVVGSDRRYVATPAGVARVRGQGE